LKNINKIVKGYLHEVQRLYQDYDQVKIDANNNLKLIHDRRSALKDALSTYSDQDEKTRINIQIKACANEMCILKRDTNQILFTKMEEVGPLIDRIICKMT